MKQAAIYARTSTSNHGQSVDVQLLDLRKLAEQRGFQVTREYCDSGQSGSKNSRPALDGLLADAKRGKFRVLLVWKLDRLGRSTAHLIQLLEEFRTWGIELISFSEGLDFSTTTGKLFYTVISAFAEFEKDTIRERVRAGLRNARAKGKMLGRPRVSVDSSRIARLRSRGSSWASIAKELGVGEGTIRRATLASAKNPSRGTSTSPSETTTG
jgi:DNA invertase Pin-like site-specific DNA recombinase